MRRRKEADSGILWVKNTGLRKRRSRCLIMSLISIRMDILSFLHSKHPLME